MKRNWIGSAATRGAPITTPRRFHDADPNDSRHPHLQRNAKNGAGSFSQYVVPELLFDEEERFYTGGGMGS